MKPQVATVLEADGFVDRVGPGRIHATLPHAVEAVQHRG